MAKLSSYQKIKLKNQELRRDIYALVYGKDVIKQLEVKTRWSILFGIEQAIWAGEPSARK